MDNTNPVLIFPWDKSLNDLPWWDNGPIDPPIAVSIPTGTFRPVKKAPWSAVRQVLLPLLVHLDNRDTIHHIQVALSPHKKGRRADPRVRFRKHCKLCLDHEIPIVAGLYKRILREMRLGSA